MSSLLTNLKVNSDGYLYIPYSEDFNFGSGDFTIEFWVKFNSWSTAYEQSVLTKGWGAGSTGSFLIYASGSSPKRISFFASDNGSSWSIASSQTIIDNLLLNQWYYVTVTRSGSTFTTFANGIQTTSWTNGAALYNSASHGITVGNSEAGTHPVDCNIDGLRITKGICRYSSSFNPPMNDDSLTTNGAFKDKSRFSKRVVNVNYVNANSTIKKFGDTSAYLNGTSYLSVPGDKAWQLGTDDFTVEAWINPNEMSSTVQSIVGNYDGADGGWRLGIKAGPSETPSTSIIQFRHGNSTVIEKSVTPPLASGTWYHLAASRSNNSLKLFLDGNELEPSASATDPHYSNVSLLLHMDGSNESTTLTDSSSDARTISVYGTAKLSTTQTRFGETSLSLGADGAISVSSDSDLQLGTSDFTIEAWIYLDVGFDARNIMDFRSSAVGSPWVLSGGTNGMSTYFAVTPSYASHPTGLAVGQWTHIAMTRSGSMVTIWVNGVAGTPANIGSANLDGQALWIGDVAGRRSSGYPSWGGGFIDEVRITKGIARYTSNFTPPNSSFPNQGPFTDDINRVNTNGLTIGASRSSSNTVTNNYRGYIDDLRITKGTARYTTAFAKPVAPVAVLGAASTAPSSPSGLAVTERDNIFKVSLTAPKNDGRSAITAYNFQYSEDGSTWNNTTVVSDPYYDKVSLLLPMTGSNNSLNIFDDSKYNHNISIVGDTKITTAQSWFGNGSAVFDGSIDNLVIENNSAFDLRNQDWTIEGWIRPTGDWSKYNTIISKRGNGGSEGTDGDWQLYLKQNNGVLSFYPGTMGGQESGAVPLVNIWNHVAAVRNGRIITVYLNGISVLSFVADTLYTTNRKVYIGGWPAGNEYFYGNMNDIRITKGVARYTTNFDPRTLTPAPANRVTGLSTIGTPYVFRARSVNSVGSSEYSSSTTPIITTLGAPSNLNVIPDNDKAYLSWTAPTSNNSEIRNYSIQYSSDNGTTWTEYSHSPSITTSIVVDGLTVGTSYSFQVAAINIAGTGTYVSTVSPVLTALREDNTYNKTRLLLHLDSN